MSKTVLITGATGLFGKQYSEIFCKKSLNLILTARDIEKLENLKEDLIKLNPAIKICVYAFNHNEKYATQYLAEQLIADDSMPHYLINNVRDIDNLKLENSGFVKEEQWHDEFQLGVVLPYSLAILLTKKPEGKLERIVNVSSMYGITVPNLRLYNNPDFDSPIHYGVIKAALNHLTKELAVRLANKNILVNAVAYGGVEGRADGEFIARYKELCPKGRMLKSEEIAGIVSYLLLSADDMLTGQVIALDGGWSVW